MQDGHKVDQHGVHHRVLDAVLETEPGKDCYGWIDVFPTHLNLVGIGDLESQVMPFDVHQQAAEESKVHDADSEVQEEAVLDRQPL